MDPKQAIDTLAQRGDKIAEALGVDEGQNWRDNTGTAHLYVRGALQSLERIANGEHSTEDAALAIGTVGFAKKSPDGFLGDNSAEAADIAMHILNTEMQGGSLSDAINTDDLDLLLRDLNSFSNDIAGQAVSVDADDSLKAFSGTLDTVNGHYQALGQSIKAQLTSPPPGPSGPQDGDLLAP